MYIIPTDSKPNQNLRCVIPIDGKNLALRLTLTFNTIAEYWVMSVADDISNEILVDSLPLIAGEFPSANILGQYGFLRIGSCVMVKLNPDNPNVIPNGNNLGTEFALVWGDTVYE
jgi:hypothetical protein